MRDDETETVVEEATPTATVEKPPKVKRAKKKAAVKAKTKATKPKAAAKPKAAKKPKAATKPKAAKVQPTGLRGDVVGARTGTAKDNVLTHLILNEKKQIPLSRLNSVAYPGQKMNGSGPLLQVLKGITDTLEEKKLKYVLRSDSTRSEKEKTIGLYPVR
jgi:outer membrane biosynthesis protein TonB